MLLSLPLPTVLDRIGSVRRTKAAARWRLGLCAALLCHAALLAVVVRASVDKLAPAPELHGFSLVLGLPEPAPVAPQRDALPAPSIPALALAEPDLKLPAFPVPDFSVAARTPARSAQPPAASTDAPEGRSLALAITGPALTGPAADSIAPAPASADTGAALAALKSRIDQAVQAAAAMPPAAIRQRREGRAQVRFSYSDGAVGDIAVAQSSASRQLDDAAVGAVRAARYPSPPAALRGRKLALLVWINFRLNPSQG